MIRAPCSAIVASGLLAGAAPAPGGLVEAEPGGGQCRAAAERRRLDLSTVQFSNNAATSVAATSGMVVLPSTSKW